MALFSLWEGGPVMEQSSAAMPVTTDSVLLADFVRPGRGRSFLDMGSGSGLLTVLLLTARPGLRAELIEINPEAAELSRRNLERNGLSAPVTTGDLREKRGRYDFIVTNPPYFPVSGGRSEDAARSAARDEGSCTLNELAESAARLLGDGGKLFFVYPAGRMAEALGAFSRRALEPKRLRLVQARADKRPGVFLAELQKSGRPGLVFEPTLILKTPSGEDTEEVRRIYHL